MNRTNLNFLWKVCARLSLHDMYTQDDDPFNISPLLNLEDIRLFVQVILASNADSQYDRVPEADALRRVLNDCKDMMNNPQALGRMMLSNETDDAHLALQLFLSLTANTQFPGQNPRPKEKAGRTLAIFEALPRRYPEKLSRENARLVGNLIPRIEGFLGTSFTQLSLCFLVLMSWQGIAYIRSRGALECQVGNPYVVSDARDRRITILSALFEEDPLLESFLTFTAERLARTLVNQAGWAGFDQHFRRFLMLFSASTEELRRSAAERPEFQLGSISNRLSPLERYPVV